MSWEQRLVQSNMGGRAGMCVAHIHGGEVTTTYQRSVRDSEYFDLVTSKRMQGPYGTMRIAVESGSGALPWSRNQAVADFLDDPSMQTADLLLFIDSDMGWDPSAPERMAQLMEDHGLPILGGLCFTQRLLTEIELHTPESEWFPTLYLWDEELQSHITQFAYPEDQLVHVGATGGAFIMITRQCLESIRDAEGDNWFTPVQLDSGKRPMGEDISFCYRARQLGMATHVHTGIQTSHRKPVYLTEASYRQTRAPASSAVTVVIPVKDELDMTLQCVRDLVGQGGYTDILLMDNGSEDPAMRKWLEEQTVADVYDASGANISQMWNNGINEAIARHRGLADVVILNNDLRCGPKFLWKLVHGMRRSQGMMAACGNYDARPGVGVTPLRGICAGRYDGHGGFAGFAFALRAEWIAGGFRFDENMEWFFSDNDLTLEIEKQGGWYGMVYDALVEHIDGGSKTERPEWWLERVKKDEEAFHAKWPHVQLVEWNHLDPGNPQPVAS